MQNVSASAISFIDDRETAINVIAHTLQAIFEVDITQWPVWSSGNIRLDREQSPSKVPLWYEAFFQVAPPLANR